MRWLTLEGVRPYDGRYEFEIDESALNTAEWGWIKRHAGYLPGTIAEGLDGSDPELFCVFAVIALSRAGKIEAREVPDTFERIAAAPFGSAIQFSDDEPAAVEDDAGPPPSSSNGSDPISGHVSTTSSASSASEPSPIGTPASATSGSGPATLVT